MKICFNKSMVLALICLVITILPACWGERTLPIKIENQTDMVLNIYVNDHYKCTVKPNKTIQINYYPGSYPDPILVAKNNNGETVFSKQYSFHDLIEGLEVVISPLDENGVQSD